MPIYEYQCTNCEHTLEALQQFSDDPLTDCPVCNESKLKKLISATSFRLKGSGWYETDFKTGKKKQLHESDSSAGAAAKSEKETKPKVDSKEKKSEKDPAKKQSQASSSKPAAPAATNSR